MVYILKTLAAIIFILIVFYCYVIFVNPNILDFSSDELIAVRKTCDKVIIGSDIKTVIANTSESGLTPLLTDDYLAIKSGVCSCRLEYKENKVVKKYIAACEVK